MRPPTNRSRLPKSTRWIMTARSRSPFSFTNVTSKRSGRLRSTWIVGPCHSRPIASFIKMKDAIGREWQGPTIQVDLNLPERFDVTFVNEKGERERAVMIHRVLFGSLERFVGGLIEHYAGNFPLWLNWEQAAVIPVRESALDYARDITKKLRGEDFRVHLDEQPGDLRNRVKEAQQRKASYMLVVGDKEAAGGTVSVRRRGSREEERGVALDAFIDRIKKERHSKALPADFSQHEPSAGDAM